MSIPKEYTGKKYDLNGAQKNILFDLTEKLKYALETEKRYLDANLTLSILAKELHTNREYLSRTIHYYFNKNYIDCINEYRVKAAIQLFQDITKGTAKNFTMLEVAHASGFKSTSTFNPAFKRVMGVTPSEYKQRIMERKVKI